MTKKNHAATIDMFPELLQPALPRAKKRVMAHIVDAGCNFGDGQERGIFQCKCGWQSEWTEISSVSEGRRGIPCEQCNSSDVKGENSNKEI